MMMDASLELISIIAGVKCNLMTIGLQYDEKSSYWYPYIELDLIPVIEESDDTETTLQGFQRLSALQ